MALRGVLGPPLPVELAPAGDTGRGDQSLWLFLSLYLLLFAFFVVLNSFSTFDSGRRDAVINSVLDAFAQVAGPGVEQSLGGSTGNALQARQFQDSVTDIFEAAIPLEALKVVAPGTRMEVDVPAQVFFSGDSVVVRDPLPMLDRIVATISSPPSGAVYELSVVAQVAGEETTPLPTDMTTEIARVGNIARALGSRGMPPTTITIGMDRGDPQFFKLIFFALEDGASRLTPSPVNEGAAL